MNNAANRAYVAVEWIAKFAYINLLWIGFSLIGLVVLGFFPATISMFTIIRKWLMGDTDIPIFRTFWTTYKSEFIRSNGLGLLVVAIAGLIVLDLVFMKNSGNSFISVVQIPLYIIMFAAVMTMFYLFPVYVHYELKLAQIIKNSFLMMLINPLENLTMIAGIVAVFFVVKVIPGLGFFFGGSLTAAIIMAACYPVFEKMEKKRRTYP
ncbi:YesL family protein [Domibacillus sp. DTU_2020_1001157_1_SI_ALB_TIR_016]|uniref:YesL family protein n=1 Tax=Domibacillus sp. DTU_2020_1001157_1_SI_ALB_TIR_016 TaxID=3077789 RepID=UPI0028EBDE51|nr:YesL family protein [Domibacillus sp. DTU_2020_1001157_1_SI_ALB_TIR_016]WNS79001.1 YesL family protein [Domibacillus sp. DTU_2020_1001157_1_SI_ALB_TIR_016]